MTGSKQAAYTVQRVEHWDRIARANQPWSAGRAYHRRLTEFFRFLIPEGSRVLEIGCGGGDLLAALKPSRGVGVDFSPEMLSLARKNHPAMEWLEMDAHQLHLEGPFDYIILSDLVNDLWNVQQVLGKIREVSNPRTRILVNFYSRMWSPFLTLASALGLAKPNLPQNWLTPDDIRNLLFLEGFEFLRQWHEVLFPLAHPSSQSILQ